LIEFFFKKSAPEEINVFAKEAAKALWMEERMLESLAKIIGAKK
jgi:hypothetical protein